MSSSTASSCAPGHQWAFALDSGWEAIKEECQPTHPVRVADDLVHVGVAVPALDPAADESADEQSVKSWIAEWGNEVATVDMATARQRFATDVSAFGTHADVVIGRDALEAQQWSQVWPAIEDFQFLVEDMQVLLSPDRLQAVAVVGWSSTGIAADGARFDRPGRATVVLRRDTIDAPVAGHPHPLLPGPRRPPVHPRPPPRSLTPHLNFGAPGRVIRLSPSRLGVRRGWVSVRWGGRWGGRWLGRWCR